VHVGWLFYFPITRNTRLSVLILKRFPSLVSFYIFLLYTLLLNYLPVYLFLSIKTFNSTLKIPVCLTWTFHIDVCMCALVADYRHREVRITMAETRAWYYMGVDDAPGLVSVDGRYVRRQDGEVERRNASGRLPRDASAQRAPYLCYTFARKTPDLSGPVTTSSPHLLPLVSYFYVSQNICQLNKLLVRI